jgi:hypothetical protein
MLRARARIQVRGTDVPVVASNRTASQGPNDGSGHVAPNRPPRPGAKRPAAKRPVPARPEAPGPERPRSKKRPGPSRSARPARRNGWIAP